MKALTIHLPVSLFISCHSRLSGILLEKDSGQAGVTNDAYSLLLKGVFECP